MPFVKGHKINVGRSFAHRIKNSPAQMLSIKKLIAYRKEKGWEKPIDFYKKISEKLKRFAPLECLNCRNIVYITPCYLKYRKYCGRKCAGVGRSGERSFNWIIDRNKLKKQNRRNDPAYKEWRRQVLLRDNFKCRILDLNCKGKLEVHHILIWSEYPELRYQTNNGITLCHAHHPRKRAEEKRLSPYFQELVSVSKD